MKELLNQYPLSPVVFLIMVFLIFGTLVHGMPVLVYAGIWAIILGCLGYGAKDEDSL